MATTAILYLAEDKNKLKQSEFLKVAQRLADEYGVDPIPISDGSQILDALARRVDHNLGQLITLCHGFPDRLFRHDMGVSMRTERKPTIISLETFARALAPKLAPDALISLGACLCGRDPGWYLLKKYGAPVDQWSPYANQDGGQASLAGRLRDLLTDPAAPTSVPRVRIRAHTVAGHITYAAPIREFLTPLGSPGWAMFGRALPGVQPTWEACRWWNSAVRGALAEDLLLGRRPDPTIFGEIRQRWASR